MARRKKFIEIVATVAPALATALGGPLAGLATRAIAEKVVGRPDATEAEVEQAILGAGTGDLVKLKQVEAELTTELQEAGVELERIAAGDRASARERQIQSGDWTPAILGVAIVIGFFGVLAYMFRYGLPLEGSEVLLVMLGALGTMTSQVGNYFFGSSAGSKTKEAIIADMKGGVK